MQIMVRYFDGCPNWRVAVERLRAVLDDGGRGDVGILLEEVTTPERAAALGFRGSPTILIDGRDPFAAAGAEVGLSCRMYATPDGLRGAPTSDQLRRALAL